MIIAISNQKGGVNKTTLTFNLGYLLAEQGKRTLVIDADPQGSLTTIFNIESTSKDICNVLFRDDLIESNIINIEENLYLLPCSIELADFELNVANEKGRENYFRNILSQINMEYDYILIDSPPSLGLLLINILNASDKVLIPTQADYLSYKGLDLLLNTIAKVKEVFNKKLNILGVVVTGYDGRTLHSREILELMEGLEILGIISNSVKVKDASLAAEPLHRYDRKHKIADEYKKIAEKVINHGK